MKVFIQALVAQLLLNPYIWWRGKQALPPLKVWRVPYALIFILEFALYMFGYLFRKELPDEVMIPIMYISGTWYIATIYITMALLALEIIRWSHRRFAWLPAFISGHWEKAKRVCFGVVSAGGIILMFIAYHAVNEPVVKHIYMTVPKSGFGRDSLTVVMMSDLHIGEMIGKKMVQKYVRLSNAQKPDLVVIVGDVIDYESRIAEREHMEDDLRSLQAPLGVYITLGNHEYRANRFAKLRWMRKTGATLLIDSVARPDPSFYLIGRDDRVNKKRSTLYKLMKDLDPQKMTLLLDHQPYGLSEASMNGVDIGLYGHTHNGQLWPYPLVMKLIYECPYGTYRKGSTQFYISSGIGVAGPPYRVGTVSELVVLHIKFKH